MNICPLNKPCDKAKTVSLLVMQGKVEETIFVCESCPLAHQLAASTEIENCCAVCKSTYKDIKNSQKLGCEFCYLFMSDKIQKVIQKVQNQATKHVGKKPSDKTKLLQKFLNFTLEKHKNENPEDAKKCDKIKNILAGYF